MNKFFLFYLCLFLSSCHPKVPSLPLIGLQITDINGVTETITNPQQLASYQENHFLQPQPYKKVILTYSGGKKISLNPSTIISYHTNGRIKQKLQTEGLVSQGPYLEWYPDGGVKLESRLSGGQGDLIESAQRSWIFEGNMRAYYPNQNLQASLFFESGLLNGEAKYFFPNGKQKEVLKYHQGLKEGLYQAFDAQERIVEKAQYQKGLLEGKRSFYDPTHEYAAEEEYKEGRLLQGIYTVEEREIARVVDGRGKKVFFEGEGRWEEEFEKGYKNGKARFYSFDGSLLKEKYYQNDISHGLETHFYPQESQQAHFSIEWRRGKLSGPVHTWYINGQKKAEFFVYEGKKVGKASAWFVNGKRMFHEEYRQGKLFFGDYYSALDPLPVSQVREGEGKVSLFDEEGFFQEHIIYENGFPT